MSLTAAGKKASGRSRCDSPPRCIDASLKAEKEVLVKSQEDSTAPALSSFLPILAIALLLVRAALFTDREELLGNTPTWAALATFLMVGAVVMRFDFIDAVSEENEKQGLPSGEQLPVVPAGFLLMLTFGTASFLAIAVVWWSHGSMFSSQALRTSIDDTPTWTALAIFVLVGSVVMRFDYIDAMKEEAEKEGLDSMDEVSLIPSCRSWLIMGFGVVLAFAAQHVNISWQLSDEATIFFLSAALVVGLATTFFVIGLSIANNLSDDPKSKLAMQ